MSYSSNMSCNIPTIHLSKLIGDTRERYAIMDLYRADTSDQYEKR